MIAGDFCLGIDHDRVMQVSFLNFDQDLDREIIGLCRKPDEKLLFVLDRQNNQWKPVLEKKEILAKRHLVFEDLKIKDIDKDGIDEIIYRETVWYARVGNSFLYLYSPKYNEWFWRDEWWRIDIETEKTEGMYFSLNLDFEKFKIFKEFLQKHQVFW